jgi:alpha-D-xyloside xylohydrolase
MVREGVDLLHPRHAYRVDATADTLTVLAPTRPIETRGDVLNTPALTIECSSPLPDVIRVTMTHHAGARPIRPRFPILGAAAGDDAEPAAAAPPAATTIAAATAALATAVAATTAAKATATATAKPAAKSGADAATSTATPKPAAKAAAHNVRITTTDASLTSGRLSVRFPREGEWRVEFLADGKPLTASESKGMGIAEANGRHYLIEELSLGIGERVYGLGERFGALIKNGQTVEIENKDGGTGSEQAYKNVPFYLTDGGYGVFVNDAGPVSFEVASEKVERVQFSIEGQSLEYFVIYGPSPKEILEKYTALTGRPALPPAWSFGLWLSTSFTTNYDEKTVGSFVDGMIDREIPLSVFHFDTFWMREQNWCDFIWDERTFPDPAGMLRRMHQRGVKVCVWINPYIAQASRLFPEAAAAGYLLKRPNGNVWQTDKWVPGMGIVDFTNPDARTWYAAKLAALLDQGVDCFKTDFGERIPTEDVVWHDGSDPTRMHNFYSYLYNQTVFNLLRERRGEGEAVVFARSATAGCQQFPVHWGGDCESTFSSMADSLRGGLSLGMSGFGFWSHDIGGFEGTPPPELYHRWSAFGLLSSHSRLHGSNSSRAPWMIDDKAVDVVASFARQKCRLMPYLYGVATEASRRGIPMMRAMLLEFPEDPTAGFLDRQYMLGPSLLVAPVFTEDGMVEHYIPAGRWTHFVTGRTLDGPAWVHEHYDVSSLPLFVRPGTIVAEGSHADRPDYDFADGVTLRAYELADGATVTTEVPDLRGVADAVFAVARAGSTVTAERTTGTKPWRLLLVNVKAVAGIEGGTAEITGDGALITPAGGAARVEITLG